MTNRIFLKYCFTPIILLLLITSCRSASKSLSYADIKYPKREFRGAWFSTAWQDRYHTMNSKQMKAYFVQSLDSLQYLGINAIIFQVRPQADAFTNRSTNLGVYIYLDNKECHPIAISTH